jgi:hypothetical protein
LHVYIDYENMSCRSAVGYVLKEGGLQLVHKR